MYYNTVLFTYGGLGGGDADKWGFMMGFPNATMYPFLGVGLILDDLVHEAVAEGVPPCGRQIRGSSAGGDRQGPATDTGRERTAPAGNADPKLLIVGGD